VKRATPRLPSRPLSSADLARLLRQSATLDPLVRDQWLRVLPHLSATHRQRLSEILAAADQGAAVPARDATASP
jgi:hypothetical protein